MGQIICKPGSVVNDHLSSLIVAYKVMRFDSTCPNGPLRYSRYRPTCHLAAGRVYLLDASPRRTVSSYLTRFTLALSFRGKAVSFLWHFP